MRNVAKIAFAALLGLGGLTLMAGNASAAIVCNGEGECWHVHHAYRYHHEWGLVVHPNSWRWGTGEQFVWREHTGRGYWHNGVWVRF